MHVDLLARRLIHAPPAAVFARATDSARFAELFAGCGPVPGITHIVADGPPAIGSRRELQQRDGSRLQECITAFDPPHHHAYTLQRLRPPMRWLALDALADWTFLPEAGGTDLRWHYRWQLTSVIAWPLAWPLLHGFMLTAMHRCLAALAASVEADASPAAEPG